MGVGLVFAVLYYRSKAAEAEGNKRAVDEKLSRVEAQFKAKTAEDRRIDVEDASAVRDHAGAVEFLRDSLRKN